MAVPESDANRILYFDEVTGQDITVQKLRVYAYLYIPSDATAEEARAWLTSQVPRMSKSVRDITIRLHLHDEVVDGWRVNDVRMSDTSGINPAGC